MSSSEKVSKQSPKATFKDFVAATGDSLSASGHKVPHSALLEAMSAAMNSRSWNQFCAELALPAPVALAAAPVAIAAVGSSGECFMPNETEVFALRLAHTLCRIAPDQYKAPSMGFVRNRACADEVLYSFQAKNGGLPVVLTSKGPDKTVIPAQWCPVTGHLLGNIPYDNYRLTIPLMPEISVSVSLPPDHQGHMYYEAWEELSDKIEMVMDGELTTFGLAGADMPYVEGFLETDDCNVTAKFDARPYLVRAKDSDLCAIWHEGLSGGYATDNIAEVVNTHVPHQGIQSVYDYIAAVHPHCDMGSTCGVKAEHFAPWLRKCRPVVYAQLLLEQEGLSVTQDESQKFSFVLDGMTSDGFADADAAKLALMDALMAQGLELDYTHLL